MAWPCVCGNAPWWPSLIAVVLKEEFGVPLQLSVPIRELYIHVKLDAFEVQRLESAHGPKSDGVPPL